MDPQPPVRQYYRSPPLVSQRLNNNYGSPPYNSSVVPTSNQSSVNSYNIPSSTVDSNSYTNTYTSSYYGSSYSTYSNQYQSPYNGASSYTYSNYSNQFSPRHDPVNYTSQNNNAVSYNSTPISPTSSTGYASPHHVPQTYGSPNSHSMYNGQSYNLNQGNKGYSHPQPR